MLSAGFTAAVLPTIKSLEQQMAEVRCVSSSGEHSVNISVHNQSPAASLRHSGAINFSCITV